MTMDPELRDQMEEQTRQGITQSASAAATQATMAKQRERIQNPNYMAAVEDPDVESAAFDWLEEEFPTWFSGAHTRGFRSQYYEEFAELGNRNRAARLKTERSPGRLVAHDEYLLAVEQGIGRDPQQKHLPDQAAFRRPMRSVDARLVDGAAEVSTNQKSLSVGGRGIDASSTATTENRVVTNDQEESKSTKERLASLYD